MYKGKTCLFLFLYLVCTKKNLKGLKHIPYLTCELIQWLVLKIPETSAPFLPPHIRMKFEILFVQSFFYLFFCIKLSRSEIPTTSPRLHLKAAVCDELSCITELMSPLWVMLSVRLSASASQPSSAAWVQPHDFCREALVFSFSPLSLSVGDMLSD